MSESRISVGQEVDYSSLPSADRIKFIESDEFAALTEGELIALIDYQFPMTEIFYSIQAEGARSGYPAVFVRFAKCNFRCSWCDSKRTWDSELKMHGLAVMKYIQDTPAKSVVITGGEPMLYRDQVWFAAFVKLLQLYDYHIEVETDGALPPNTEMLKSLVDQWNVSPKIGSSGIEMTEKYFNALAEWSQENKDFWFKFVIANEADLQEALELSDLLGVDRERLILMPEGETKDKQLASMGWLVNRCIELGIKFGPRVHILIWNDTPGV